VKDESGLVVSVTPEDDMGQDGTYPVNMALRTGARQNLATGWGETGPTKPQRSNYIQFTLSKSEFQRPSSMANETLASHDESTAKYSQELSEVPTGLVEIRAEKLVTTSDGQRIRLARLRIVVTTPRSFRKNPRLYCREAACPSP